jgi:hypothetical protein
VSKILKPKRRKIMKKYLKLYTSLVFAAAALFCSTNVHAQESMAYGEEHIETRMGQLERRIHLLEMEKIVLGPVTISKVRFGDQRNYFRAYPGQNIECSIHYELDADQEAFLEKHHLVVGLSSVGAEQCIAHSYGIWDNKGKRSFKLVAPLEEGEYDVKVAHFEAASCEDAYNAWNVLEQEPSKYSTIGIIKVRNK